MFLYTFDVLFHVDWCIRYTASSDDLPLYFITSLAQHISPILIYSTLFLPPIPLPSYVPTVVRTSKATHGIKRLSNDEIYKAHMSKKGGIKLKAGGLGGDASK